jgi:hypothetical protein
MLTEEVNVDGKAGQECGNASGPVHDIDRQSVCRYNVA